ncbi:putative catalytic protein [Rosellinia necatrix]|uniref:Putative catalytic protein n=1 Tax=Rosellinia necatrix TaxID=77044 RepID=A0A1W2TWY5_ROSNE|nr:putative catalytic protein [Rosellinia necatrix]
MASPRKPTLVLVQGSFQLPEAYYKLADALSATGYRVEQPSLPSLTDQDKPDFASKSLTDDALAIRSKVAELVEEGETVVMVLHSYGGLVGTEAVTKDLSFDQRKSQGLAGGVLHLFYFAAFILTEGQSVLSTFGESPNNLVKPNGRFAMKNTAEILYHDLPATEAQYWESKTIDQSYAVQTTAITNEGFRHVRSTYVVCENDRGPPPQYQEMFGKTAGSDVLKLSSGHSPMLSHTEKLVEMINTAVQSAVEGKPAE